MEQAEVGLIAKDEFDWLVEKAKLVSVSDGPKGKFLNIGCNDGKGSCTAILKGGSGDWMVCVDPWLSDTDYANFNDYMISIGGLWRIIAIRDSSDHFFEARINPRELFRFIFIDGDHSYPQVVKDIKNSWDHLEEGGILALHDCDMEAVRRAVLESGDFTQGCRSIWYRQKPKSVT